LALQFGSDDSSGDAADLDDFDKDGLVNLVEFALDLNPKASDVGRFPKPYGMILEREMNRR
jgi:hypothetical protein